MVNNSRKIAINIFAQYGKTLVNVFLSLYATRIVLSILGSDDYGVYSLIAGVVSMLSFLSNSMIISTQRFLSFYQGKRDYDKLKLIFSDSLSIHLIVGILLTTILACCTPLLFNGFLNIPYERIEIAKDVYLIVLLILFITLISSPFNAAIISNEDIYIVSIIDVIDGVLKLVFVLLLKNCLIDKLLGYAICLMIIQIIRFLFMAIVSIRRYQECNHLRFGRLSGSYIRELASFAGWTIYSNGCIIGRTQGTAILINKFLGTIKNASFGIALQVSGFVSFVSSSVLNAMTPQIIKSEGNGDREQLISISAQSSKISYLLLLCAVVPICFYIQPLLEFWLGDVPAGSSFFCIMVMIASLVDTITIGLGIANQAIGQIRNYSLVVNTIKLSSLVPIWISLHNGGDACDILIWYICFELLCAVIRLPFLKVTAGLRVKWYLKEIIIPIILSTLVITILIALNKYLLHANFVVAVFITIPVFLLFSFFLVLNRSEKDIIISLIHKFI